MQIDLIGKLRKTIFTTENHLQSIRKVLDEHIDLFQQIIEESLPRNPETINAVSQALNATASAFRLVEGVGEQNFPESFWKKPEGQLLSAGYKWLHGDDLISLKEAATIIFGITESQYTHENKWRSSMNTFICGRYGKPSLRTFYDESLRYPIRVSRSEVEKFAKGYSHQAKPFAPRRSRKG